MFSPSEVGKLAARHRNTLKSLSAIEARLNERFYELKPAIRALVLSVASGEPLLLIGPPGTGKSKLIRAFCGMTGLFDETDPSEEHEGYFEYLLTPFTEPGELFGYYDIAKAMDGKGLMRIDRNSMQKAQVVYLDEVFNGSSAILNSLLAFMNEGVYHDRGMRIQVPLQCFFAATNQVPQTVELRAIFDRFVLRCTVQNVEADPKVLGELLRVGWKETYGGPSQDKAEKESVPGVGGSSPKPTGAAPASSGPYGTLLPSLKRFQNDIESSTRDGLLLPQSDQLPFYRELAQRVAHIRNYELSEMSNRRMVKMAYIMLVHRIYEAVCDGELDGAKTPALQLRSKEELDLMWRYFLDDTNEEVVQRLERTASRTL